ncbi:MAG: TetR/AcrR family transcriptional regulator [Clostridia bacterium]|nr:TetR/AcrR family transcriptional regulator [Clostridia bacterium]
MANVGHQKKYESSKSRILHAAAKLFLRQGYQSTTVAEIAREAGADRNAIFYIFGDKETLLSELVAYVLEGQFEATKGLVADKTEDPILFYAAGTTLQLYMAESSEHIREMYAVSYSLTKPSDVIYHTITGKLEKIFGAHLPHLETKDFFELEIASGGIMRSFMTVPCDMYFTMDRKVRRFLETTFLVYRVSDEKIDEAVQFVSQFDYPAIAQHTVDHMLNYLESKT